MMSVETFEMLKIAVDVARERNLQSIDAVRTQLLRDYPAQAHNIDAAIAIWIEHKRKWQSINPSA